MPDPRATYRLQLHGLGFAGARALVPYLAELGVSHLYLSPILQAAAGSTHSYDVVDPTRPSAELGGDAELAALAAAVQERGMALLVDIVPNHMSISPPQRAALLRAPAEPELSIAPPQRAALLRAPAEPELSIAGSTNRWWLDVLANGAASSYAHFFDVDWAAGADRIALPVLGDRYGRELAAGRLGVVHDGAGGFAVRAGDLRLPIAPESLADLIRRAGERAGCAELAFLADALAELPHAPAATAGALLATRDARRRRHRDLAVIAARLAALCREPASGAAAAIDAEVAALAVDRVELDAVLEAQAYRLAHWSVAASELTYRRFFDITTLVGIHVEEPDVFDASHAAILGWLADGVIAGVRVDHVDGLRDPAAYLARLRERAPGAWIVVEKVLGTGEQLPPWPIDGTTGYEHAERVTGLLVDPAGEQMLTEAFAAYTGGSLDIAVARRDVRREVMSGALRSELARLVELAARACARAATARDYTRGEIERALVEILAGYAVYRTYLTAGGEPSSTANAIERARIADAAADALASGRAEPDLISFLAAALAGDVAQSDARDLALAAQQVTGAIVAKGDEDTLGYRAVRLVARCEVGADPGVLSAAPDDVHRALAAAAPRTLLATATHDTKRGEDARARIAVLSEVPGAWRTAVLRWRARADRYWRGAAEPDRALEYLLWQTLIGAWPLDAERACAYAQKAAREAHVRTSWHAPDLAFEAALDGWLRGVLGDPELAADLGAFAASLAPRARANSLAQLLIKLAAPGVPDIYQGCELADYSLVDPDNRRPVDFAARQSLLATIAGRREGSLGSLGDDLGLAKLWTIRRVLALRRARPELFATPYRALAARGPRAERVFAFARGDDSMMAIIPRLGPIDPETSLELPPGVWRDVLSDRDHAGGRAVPLAQIWSAFPIALLLGSRR